GLGQVVCDGLLANWLTCHECLGLDLKCALCQISAVLLLSNLGRPLAVLGLPYDDLPICRVPAACGYAVELINRGQAWTKLVQTCSPLQFNRVSTCLQRFAV